MRLLNKYRVEIVYLGILVFIYICIRSLHFSQIFNFSSEQASFSTTAMRLLKEHKIELIGPPISWRYEGRYFFQGSLTFYALIPFLILGRWDPVASTYWMVLFGAIMLVFLYISTRLLTNRKKATIISFLFATVPFYIDYSRFFWNPNLQFLFSPFVILWMGLFKKYRKTIFLFLVSLTSGALMLFHYQFFAIICGLIVYYLFFSGINVKKKIIFLLGFPLGFSPLIVFELRNHFYNLQTLLLFFSHAKQVFPQGGSGLMGIITSYYMLCPSLFLTLLFLKRIKIINMKVIMAVGIMILIYSLSIYLPVPTRAFGMARDWNYLMEKKVYDIIRAQKIEGFNVVNLGYDTVAAVQKYFLIRDGVKGNWEDYYHNKYLFLITYPQDYMRNPAYEINTFSPNIVLKKWTLNDRYTMYLLERK